MKELPKHDTAFLDHATASEAYVKFTSSSCSFGTPHQDPLCILTDDWALLVSGLDLAEEDRLTEIPDS